MSWWGQSSQSRETEIADAETAEDFDPDAEARNFPQKPEFLPATSALMRTNRCDFPYDALNE